MTLWRPVNIGTRKMVEDCVQWQRKYEALSLRALYFVKNVYQRVGTTKLIYHANLSEGIGFSNI